MTTALENIYKSGEILTKELGGQVTTEEFTNAVVEHLVR